jgi:hypothetical protein
MAETSYNIEEGLAFVLADFAVEINNTDDELFTDFEDEFVKKLYNTYI